MVQFQFKYVHVYNIYHVDKQTVMNLISWPADLDLYWLCFKKKGIPAITFCKLLYMSSLRLLEQIRQLNSK